MQLVAVSQQGIRLRSGDHVPTPPANVPPAGVDASVLDVGLVGHAPPYLCAPARSRFRHVSLGITMTNNFPSTSGVSWSHRQFPDASRNRI